MSDSQAYEEITVSSDGVTVTKRFEADEFPVPAIAFNVESERKEPVTVQLIDDVPEGVAVEDLGFHPEYGSEYWTIEEDEIAFEREIEPASEYTTVYGIRATGTDNVEQFLTEPALESVAPPLDGDVDALVSDSSDAVKDVIAGDSDSVPGLDDEQDDDIGTLDLKDPNDEGTQTASADTADASADAGTDSESDTDEGPADVEVSGDSLVNALANELRENEVSADDVKLLRRAFELASQESGSVVARVEKLQSDVDEVLAYTEALEEFLDENGTGNQMIEEFSAELETFDDELDELRADLDGVQTTTADNSEQLDSVEGEISDMEARFDEIEGEIDDVRDEIGDGELADRIDSLEDEIDDLREDVSDTDVEERFDEIHEEIEELKEWREQLSSVIGGE
ncbi:MAG: hypothetical protein ABEH35_07110 [Haloarculaceae archaeon]